MGLYENQISLSSRDSNERKNRDTDDGDVDQNNIIKCGLNFTILRKIEMALSEMWRSTVEAMGLVPRLSTFLVESVGDIFLNYQPYY